MNKKKKHPKKDKIGEPRSIFVFWAVRGEREKNSTSFQGHKKVALNVWPFGCFGDGVIIFLAFMHLYWRTAEAYAGPARPSAP